MRTKTLQSELSEIEAELLNLKTVQMGINFVQTYEYELLNATTKKLEITYNDGKNDIITRVYFVLPTVEGALNRVLLLKPVGNKQIAVLMNDANGYFVFVSTRPIKSVVSV